MKKTIFYAPDILKNYILPQDESSHCSKVLRKKEGDIILITDGKGNFFASKIIDPHPKHCLVEIINTEVIDKNWSNYIHIAFAPTKNIDRLEWFAEKATEIGIDELSPILCRYSERKEIKIPRIEKILISAMKQSQKALLPKLNEMSSFSQFIKQPFDGYKFIAHCYNDNTKKNLKEIYKRNKNVLILIGPEGDFSEQEVDMAKRYGFESISLGNSRLRSETAAFVACNIIQIINQ